jgi:glucan 1,3-beta-glucosidase
MFGVNVGGWLLRENWIFPKEMPPGVDDEWTLIRSMGGPESPEARHFMERHWDTFLTESDLDTLKDFGITHVRIPLGWWTLDYNVSDGFVDGGRHYLERALDWLQQRNMSALLDLHALPGSQARGQSFTGRIRKDAYFFSDPAHLARGKGSMLKLANFIKDLEAVPSRANAVMGIELVNEPLVCHFRPNAASDLKALYAEMVPQIREILPASRYSIFLSWVYPDVIVDSGPWLEQQIRGGPPEVWCNVIYDRHLYHAYGDDDNANGPQWTPDMDRCKTCCRDPEILGQIPTPFVVGEWSLTTGTMDRDEHSDPEFLRSFWANQMSMFKTSGALGCFFWSHRIMPSEDHPYRFLEFDLLDLIRHTQLASIGSLDLTQRCPGTDLSTCPAFDAGQLAGNGAGSLPCQFTNLQQV